MWVYVSARGYSQLVEKINKLNRFQEVTNFPGTIETVKVKQVVVLGERAEAIVEVVSTYEHYRELCNLDNA